MTERVIVAIVTGPPLAVDVRLSPPVNSRLEALRRELVRPLTTHQSNLLIEKYRVEEALYGKLRAALDAPSKAIPIICHQQERYLLTGDSKTLVDVSLSEVADHSGVEYVLLVQGLRGLDVEIRGERIRIDDLVGPIGKGRRRLPLGLIQPEFLIPTDVPRDRGLLEVLKNIFTEGRGKILDPVLVLEDPESAGKGLICSGNHHAGAAYATGKNVRVGILRTEAQLRAHLKDGLVAQYAQRLSFDEFVTLCRTQAKTSGLYEKGWNAYCALTKVAAIVRVADAVVREIPFRTVPTAASPTQPVYRGPKRRLEPFIRQILGQASGPLSAEQVTNRLLEMGILPKELPKSMEILLRHGIGGIVEISGQGFVLRDLGSH